MQSVTLNEYYNELVAGGRTDVPTFNEAAKDLARSYAFVLLAA